MKDQLAGTLPAYRPKKQK